MPELDAIAPINRNIGIADRSQFAANTNGVSRSTLSATLKLRRYHRPRKATPPMATPIGTRSPIRISIMTMLLPATWSVVTRLPPPDAALAAAGP